jgi:hypothetical protein
LNEGLFGVEFSLIVLGINVDFVTQFLSFGDSHDFPPIGEELLLVEVDNFMLALNFRSKNILLHLGQLLQLVEFLLRLGDLPDFDVFLGRQSSWTSTASFQSLTQ